MANIEAYRVASPPLIPRGEMGDDAPVYVPSIEWGEVLRVWLRSLWFILPAAALGAIVAFVLASQMTPVYETGAVLLLDRPSSGSLGNAADSPPANPQEKASLVNSQIAALRGTAVVSRVIDQLDLAAQPMFNVPPGLMSRLLGRVAGLLPGGGKAAKQTESSARNQLVSAYLDRLSISQEPGTYVLSVGFRAPDPALAAKVANAEVAAYIDWARREQADAIKSAQAWLASELAQAHERAVAAEGVVRDFNKGGVLLNVEGRTSLDQALTQLTTELATAQANLVQTQARADEIRRLQEAGETAGLAAMSDSKVLEALQAEYTQSRAATSVIVSDVGPRHPRARQAIARDEETKAAVQREVAHFVEGETSKANVARATVANLTAALDKVKQQVVDAEGDRSTLMRLEGVAQQERDNYLSVLKKLRAYDNVDQLVRPDVTVLSQALPPDVPYAPRKGLFAAFGFLLGGALAAFGAVLWRGRRDLVRHSSDAMNLTGIASLGVMPKLMIRGGSIDRQHITYSFFCEELRSICATLVRNYARHGSDGVSVSVMVTSSFPREGKSTFCEELGRFAAEGGVRTLIVDTELPPKEHDGPAATHETPQRTGTLPLYRIRWAVPTTMLGGQRPFELLEAWHQEFDLVVFDTPPLSAMAESVILAPLVDATVVLARADHTPRSLLASVIRQIERAHGQVAGLVMTFAQLDRKRGMAPSDIGYYFRQNRSYHRRLISAMTEKRG